jgi:hypothetical protein
LKRNVSNKSVEAAKEDFKTIRQAVSEQKTSERNIYITTFLS